MQQEKQMPRLLVGVFVHFYLAILQPGRQLRCLSSSRAAAES